MSLELREVEYFDDIELNNMLNKKRLKLLIDTDEKEVHHVLSKKHHIDEALIYLGIKEKELAKIKPSHLVSVQIVIENKIIKEVYIGGGSLEKEYKNQTGENLHSIKELEKAEKILNKVMNLSKQLHTVKLIEDISEHEYIIPS